MPRARLFRFAAVSVTALHLSCGDRAPTGPVTGPAAGVTETPIMTATFGTLGSLNAPPTIVVRTTPAADYSTDPPTISGPPPLTGLFNLCQSEDTDPGDSLNWQFNFGDSAKRAFNDDGTFNPDTDHVCRTEHTYAEGTYTTWVSVTDKHLEDQSKGARSLARKSQAITIRAEFPRSPSQPPASTPSPSPSLPPPPACATITRPGGCPTGVTTFCVSDPVVSPTNSAHARIACNTCLGSCSNVTLSCFLPGRSAQTWRDFAGGTYFVYGGALGSPGDVLSGAGAPCPPVGRWAP